jgi:uncharacterized RDD family membrane protein YckC
MTRQVTIVTPENAEITYELAGLGSRMVACLLDTLIQLGLALVVIIPMLIAGALGMVYGGIVSQMSGWVEAIAVMGVFLLIWGYYLGYEAARNGQTPGKRVLRVRVVRDNGQPIDFSCAAVRNLMRYIDFLPAGYSVGIISILFSPTYRRLGDYAAGTMVVRERLDAPQPIRPESAAAEPAPFDGDLSGLTRDDHEAVKRFVERRRELASEVQADLARRMASPIMEKMGIEAKGEFDYIAFLESLHRRLNEDRERQTWQTVDS